jgi:ADP-ribose pyrophosphatase YjhB (NUDIX family)
VRADNRSVVADIDQYDYFQIFTGSVRPYPDEIVYHNTKTVVVVAMCAPSGIVLTRRADPGTYGKLAFPAGFQEEMDGSWQRTGAREVLEETGIVIDPQRLMHFSTETVEDGKINLLFCYYLRQVQEPAPREPDAEVLEILTTKEPVDLVFDTHTKFLKAFLRVAQNSLLIHVG